MAVRLKVDGVAGKCAIYTGGDDAPFDYPLEHVDKIRFHSDLQYPRIISTHTGTWTLPAVAAQAGFVKRSTNLFAHGLSGTPYVEGFVTVSGVKVPLLGSVPLNRLSGTRTGFAARWVHLGADATNVIMNEATVGMYESGHGTFDVDWTVYLTDTLI